MDYPKLSCKLVDFNDLLALLCKSKSFTKTQKEGPETYWKLAMGDSSPPSKDFTTK